MMQDPIEQLTEEQLIHIIVLLEQDQKKEAIQYIMQHSTLNQEQALEVIAAILMEHDAALHMHSSGPRFSDDLSSEQTASNAALTDSIAVSEPEQALKRSPVPPVIPELQEKIADPVTAPKQPHLLWISAGIVIFILLLVLLII